jgi:hypothetical protein
MHLLRENRSHNNLNDKQREAIVAPVDNAGCNQRQIAGRGVDLLLLHPPLPSFQRLTMPRSCNIDVHSSCSVTIALRSSSAVRTRANVEHSNDGRLYSDNPYGSNNRHNSKQSALGSLVAKHCKPPMTAGLLLASVDAKQALSLKSYLIIPSRFPSRAGLPPSSSRALSLNDGNNRSIQDTGQRC